MKLAFVLFHYFPYGGLERDMLAIASACAARGHEVVIYTREWIGQHPANIDVKELAVKGFTNHGRAINFIKAWQQAVSENPVDRVVGFNKMSGLDVYFAADVCFAQKAFEERGWWYRQTSRCRTFLQMEEAVFGRDSKTRVMLIASTQIPSFKRYYQTPDDRMYLLPPGIRRDRIMPENYWEMRKTLRSQYELQEDTFLLLMVGSDFQRKGVALAIKALSGLPEDLRCRTRLWIAGQGNPQKYHKLSETLGVREKIALLGARDDVAQLMWAADMFLHPAYSEAAGAVLLEAAVAGLPVVATDVCGYADFIRQMKMGQIINVTDAETRLADIVASLSGVNRQQWYARSRNASNNFNIFSMVGHAVEFIESARP